MKTLYKWSIADYHQIIESGVLEGKSVELLEGEIIAVSPESPIHSSRIDTVAEYLRKALQGIAKVREAHPITLDDSEPEPDIAIVRFNDNNYATRHPYSQDIYWLIEISNKTLTKDLSEKRCDPADVSLCGAVSFRAAKERAPRQSVIYARNGIAEYWVIDLVNKKLWLFTNLEKDSYQNRQELTTGIINPIAFPQINIEAEKLLTTI